MHPPGVLFERSDSFVADYRRLTHDERALFRAAVRRFHDATEAIVSGAATARPASLRVKGVQQAPGIFEMTWSFSGPDGRATFEWVTIPGPDGPRPGIRWRRIGGHEVFRRP